MLNTLEFEVEMEAIYAKQKVLLQDYYENIGSLISLNESFSTHLGETFDQCSKDLREVYQRFLSRFKNHILERKFLSSKEFSFFCSRAIGGEFTLMIVAAREKNEQLLLDVVEEFMEGRIEC